MYHDFEFSSNLGQACSALIKLNGISLSHFDFYPGEKGGLVASYK